MTIANTKVLAKVAAAFAVASLALASFALSASAQSTTATTNASACASFNRDLTMGSTGADVTALQNWLISKGFTIAAGATGYFGGQTQAALAQYQASVKISPAAGYFGPITRAQVSASCGNTGGNTGGDTDEDEDEDEDEDNDDLSGGEASLENLDIRDGEDDEVEEGDTAQIAEIESDVEDGDIRIDRVDLQLVAEGGAGEDEPWEVFETITLYDEEGDELASEDVSDEDDWLDEDDGTFRFTGLDYVVREGDVATIVVEVETQNNVLDDAEDSWTLTIEDEAIRGVDAEGIQQYLDDTDSITFDVVEEGADDELEVSSSDEDPDSMVLQVEDDGRSDEFTIFAFDIEADEDGCDVELDTVTITLDTTTAQVTDVINDLVLVIDGEEFDDFDYDGGADDTSREVTFDIDGDVTVEAGDVLTAELMVEFRALDGTNFDEGETIRARVLAGDVTGEGADDLSSTGSATGETHTLSVTGIEVTDVESSEDRNEAGDVGTFSFEFTVEATDGDVVVNTGDIDFEVIGPAAGRTVTTQLSRISGDATGSAGGPYTVEEGDEATFSFDVTVSVTADAGNGNYRVNLENVEGVEVDETSGALQLTNL